MILHSNPIQNFMSLKKQFAQTNLKLTLTAPETSFVHQNYEIFSLFLVHFFGFRISLTKLCLKMIFNYVMIGNGMN